MSPIGKIFVVVNLALAAAFLGWASNVVATSQDWKQQHASVEGQLQEVTDELESTKADLRTQLEAALEAKERAESARDDEKNRADRAERERDDQVSENQQMRGDLTELRSSLDDYNQHLESVDARVERATDQALRAERERNEAQQAQRDAEIALRDAEEAARKAESRLAALEARISETESMLASKEAELNSLVAYTGVNLSDVIAQPDIEGAVVSVKSDPAPGLVAINRGSEDGVKLGTTFEVFEGRTYKGQVRVEIVHPTWSSAIVVRPGVDGATISSGDSVATRL